MEHWQRFLKRKLACQGGDRIRATRAYGPSSGEIVKLDSDMTGAAQRGDEAAPLTIADARR